jgi:hypothetical protein
MDAVRLIAQHVALVECDVKVANPIYGRKENMLCSLILLRIRERTN